MTTAAQDTAAAIDDIGKYEYGWHDANDAGATARRGLNEDVVRDISSKKNEPDWMLQMRLKGLRLFEKKPMHYIWPEWPSEAWGTGRTRSNSLSIASLCRRNC